MVPRSRLRRVNDAPVRPERPFVVLWVNAARRLRDSHALDQACAHARALGRPLLVFEALRVDYPHASPRLHRFLLDGMADHALHAARHGVAYVPFVERTRGEGKGVLAAVAAHAAIVVTDDFPTFFLPRMLAAAGASLDVALEAVDGNGLLPLSLLQDAPPSAYVHRRRMQALLPPQLDLLPAHDPLAAPDLPRAPAPALPFRVETEASLRLAPFLDALPIDHSVGVTTTRGGMVAAEAALARFVQVGLAGYLDRNHPDDGTTSGLSPYLHFGHVAAHRVLQEVVAGAPLTLAPNGGRREGYFGLDAAREAFLDQLLVWRELGYVVARLDPLHASYDGVPGWARASLEAHAGDPRTPYSLERLEAAETDDPVWNAAQRELRVTGAMHNYLRMLWAKKLLLWSHTPREAFERAVLLNDRYALDGRDPNSYTGISWAFGRFDRPWGPEAPVFGVVRRMTSAQAVRKLRMKRYLARYGGAGPLFDAS